MTVQNARQPDPESQTMTLVAGDTTYVLEIGVDNAGDPWIGCIWPDGDREEQIGVEGLLVRLAGSHEAPEAWLLDLVSDWLGISGEDRNRFGRCSHDFVECSGCGCVGCPNCERCDCNETGLL